MTGTNDFLHNPTSLGSPDLLAHTHTHLCCSKLLGFFFFFSRSRPPRELDSLSPDIFNHCHPADSNWLAVLFHTILTGPLGQAVFKIRSCSRAREPRHHAGVIAPCKMHSSSILTFGHIVNEPLDSACLLHLLREGHAIHRLRGLQKWLRCVLARRHNAEGWGCPFTAAF